MNTTPEDSTPDNQDPLFDFPEAERRESSVGDDKTEGYTGTEDASERTTDVGTEHTASTASAPSEEPAEQKGEREGELTDAEKDAAADEADSKRKIILSLFAIGALVLGAVSAFAYEYFSQTRQAQNEVQEIVESQADISSINTDVMDYGSSGDDYALGVGGAGNHPESGVFIFGSDSGEYTYAADVYIDYANTRSRDFFFANNAMLRGLIESAGVQLRVHPVPSDHPYSMYAAETMAQVFHRYPDQAWEVNISLLQLSEDVLEMEEPTPEGMLNMIESELNRYHDINDIDTDLIMDAMFVDWLSATGSDQRLQGALYPPLVYSNGQLISDEHYFVPEDLRGNILSPPETEFSDEELDGAKGEADTGAAQDEEGSEGEGSEGDEMADINEGESPESDGGR